jgi:hypothetical protein
VIATAGSACSESVWAPLTLIEKTMRFVQTFQLSDFLDTLVSLMTAFVLGTLIGAERQYRQRSAGLRTTSLSRLARRPSSI